MEYPYVCRDHGFFSIVVHNDLERRLIVCFREMSKTKMILLRDMLRALAQSTQQLQDNDLFKWIDNSSIQFLRWYAHQENVGYIEEPLVVEKPPIVESKKTKAPEDAAARRARIEREMEEMFPEDDMLEDDFEDDDEDIFIRRSGQGFGSGLISELFSTPMGAVIGMAAAGPLGEWLGQSMARAHGATFDQEKMRKLLEE